MPCSSLTAPPSRLLRCWLGSTCSVARASVLITTHGGLLATQSPGRARRRRERRSGGGRARRAAGVELAAMRRLSLLATVTWRVGGGDLVHRVLDVVADGGRRVE